MSRREESAEGEAWDGGTWVDIGDDDRWHPSVAERTRAFVLLGVLLGFLLLAAVLASVGGDDDPVATPATSTSSTTTEPEQTTTTQALPSSLDGETPPDACLDDNRQALPLRDRSEITVAVLNGARVNGLASRVSDELRGRGYTAGAGDATATEITAIVHVDGFCAEAVQLAEDLGVPDAGVASGAPTQGAQVEVVLGQDEFLE